ncbi:MAG: isoprenylcysteine carboxylmethyltransferase family protein [Nitrospirae bacterium]|nr:isoprenylcysteine carboxylmethyltransferase family protein [Nitrospirota bacterium]
MQQTFSESLKNSIFKNRITLSFLCAAFFLYFAAPSRTTVFTGIPIILIGEIMRTWASGYIRKNEVLSQTGPYAFTRNPLYVGNFLIGAGFSIMTGRLLIIIFFLAAFSYIYMVTIQNEEKFLSAKFGEIFSRYKDRVPVFFPVKLLFSGPAPHDNTDSHFAWELVMKHREYHTWLGILAGLIILIAKAAFITAK